MAKKLYELQPNDEVALNKDLALYMLIVSLTPAYSSTSAYAVGAFCSHGGYIYQCTTAIASGGEVWTAAHWSQRDLSSLFSSANTSLMGLCRYPIQALTVTDGAATAVDSTINTITPTAATTVAIPASTGKARDYIVTVQQGATAYGVTFSGTFLKDFTDWPTMAANETYIFSFTEVASGTFMAAYKKVS